MAVDEALNAYSTTASSNTPAGTDSVGTDLDNHIRDIKKNIAYGSRWPVQAAKTTTYTHAITDLHQWVTADTSGGAFSINLVAAATAGDGFAFGVKLLVAGNTLTIDGSGSETIDGTTTITMDSQYEAVILVCDGSNWHIATGGPVEGDNVDITNTTALTALADADEVLVYDATATANRKITVANFSLGLDYVLLGTASASADEYITFAEVFSTTYVAYKVVWSEVKCTDDAKGILIQFGTGSTPTWIAGTNYTRQWNAVYGGSHFIGADASNIAHGTSVATGTGNDYERETGHLFVGGTHNSANNARLYFEVLRMGTDNADALYMYHEMGSVARSADITSIRFTAGDTGLTPAHTAETIASGEFRVYGLRNA